MRIYFPVVWICVFFSVLSCFAQTDLSNIMQKGGGSILFGMNGEILKGTARFNPPGSPVKVVAGAPFCADEIGEQVQTLADGNQITSPISNSHICRDSEGRIRKDESPFRFMPVGRKPSDYPIVPEIYDPVAGYQYFLDTAKRIAHRFAIPEMSEMQRMLLSNRSANNIRNIPANPQTGTPAIGGEPLGTKEIEGLLAEGTRRTMTFAAGVMGNDRPMVSTTETWHSEDIQRTILSRTTDPRSGERITALVNIDLMEPDPELFQVPDGYTIQDETDTFTINFGTSTK